MTGCEWTGYENAVFVFLFMAGIGVMIGAPFAMIIVAMGWADR